MRPSVEWPAPAGPAGALSVVPFIHSFVLSFVSDVRRLFTHTQNSPERPPGDLTDVASVGRTDGTRPGLAGRARRTGPTDRPDGIIRWDIFRCVKNVACVVNLAMSISKRNVG